MLGQLKICQHNTSRGREILQSLFEISLTEESSILFIQEPYLFQHPQSKFFIPLSHPSYIPIMPCQQHNLKPRILTYVKKNLPFQINPRYDLVSDPDLQILQIDLPQESFYVVHIYQEKSRWQGEGRHTIQRFLDLNLQLDKPFLLLGDLNIHHPWWNHSVTNITQAAQSLVDYLSFHNAKLLISPTEIERFGGTFYRTNSKNISVIDLAFSCGFQSLAWRDWKYAESTGSDHEAIVFEAKLTAASEVKTCLPTKYNVNKADWKLYQKRLIELQAELQQELDEVIDCKMYDKIAHLLENIIKEAADQAIPKLRISAHSKVWWNPQLTQLRKEFHRLRRISMRYPSFYTIEHHRVKHQGQTKLTKP